MSLPQVKSIRALARGLQVLQLLQSSGPMGLAQLHSATGVPKASLLRILKTLTEEGAIWQRMADSAYVASHSLSDLAAHIDRETELVEVASPHLVKLSDEVQWPSVLAAPRLTFMEVIETNASKAMISDVPLGPVGFQINMLRSASGRAYLAACDPGLRAAIFERLRLSPRAGHRWAHVPGFEAQMLEEADRLGVSLREPDFGGDYDQGRDRKDDARDSMAAAICIGSDVPGAINITWNRRVFSRDKALDRFAGPVQRTATAIAKDLSRRHALKVSPSETSHDS